MNDVALIQKPGFSAPVQIFFWLLALLSFGRLVHHGWQSAHAFQGDDGHLYLGWRQLVKFESYNLKHEPVQLVHPGEKLAPMLGPILNAYPPHTAVFYLPFALLPWSLSHNLWTILNIACLLLCLYLLFDRYGRNIPRSLLPLWLAALFLSGPPYAVLFYGQDLFPILLCMLIAWRMLENPDRYGTWPAGMLYSVAMVKPTISLPFVAYHLARRSSRRTAQVAIGLTLVFSLAVKVGAAFS